MNRQIGKRTNGNRVPTYRVLECPIKEIINQVRIFDSSMIIMTRYRCLIPKYAHFDAALCTRRIKLTNGFTF